jgi:hypothetical protein
MNFSLAIKKSCDTPCEAHVWPQVLPALLCVGGAGLVQGEVRTRLGMANLDKDRQVDGWTRQGLGLA